MDRFQELKKITKRLFKENTIEKHPLFIVLEQNKLTPLQTKEAALQIFHVVSYFPRFLSAILTNMPDYHMRMPLVENLFEEHGRMNERLVHSETYRDFLKGLGITEEEIQASEPIISVLAYNRAITDLCLHYHYLEGLSALGVIEEIVARVSPIVGRNSGEQYGNDQVAHFTDHETLDISHANEIYEVISKKYEGAQKDLIHRGFHMGMYYHKRLYTDIIEHIQALEI